MSQPNHPALQQLHCLDLSSPDFDDQLCNILYGEGYKQCVRNGPLEGDDQAWLVDYLDKALGCLDRTSFASRQCLRELRMICGAGAILPTSYTSPSLRLSVAPSPFASGDNRDMYEGTLDGSKVCVKRVPVYIQDGPTKAAKTFCREAVMCKNLTHPGILHLLGVTIAPFRLISDWMPCGELPGYIRNFPEADRIILLYNVAVGLCYLHSCGVIHGGIKGSNILVYGLSNTRITGFSHAAVVEDEGCAWSDPDERSYTPPWAAPEILEGEGTYSMGVDIFAFAMVMIEVFTGKIPFSNFPPAKAMFTIMQGFRPPRPIHTAFIDCMWELVQRCWDHDHCLRPEAPEVLEALAMILEIPLIG